MISYPTKKLFAYFCIRKCKRRREKLLDFWLRHPNPDPAEKVEIITSLYNKLGIHQQAKTMMENYYTDAMDLLAAVEVSIDAKKPLYELAEKLLDRNH